MEIGLFAYCLVWFYEQLAPTWAHIVYIYGRKYIYKMNALKSMLTKFSIMSLLLWSPPLWFMVSSSGEIIKTEYICNLHIQEFRALKDYVHMIVGGDCLWLGPRHFWFPFLEPGLHERRTLNCERWTGSLRTARMNSLYLKVYGD